MYTPPRNGGSQASSRLVDTMSDADELELEDNASCSSWVVLEGNDEHACDSDSDDLQLEDNNDEPTVLAGSHVRLHGLQAKPGLNGRAGVALRHVPARDRWAVRLDCGTELALKVQNLRVVEAETDESDGVVLEENDVIALTDDLAPQDAPGSSSAAELAATAAVPAAAAPKARLRAALLEAGIGEGVAGALCEQAGALVALGRKELHEWLKDAGLERLGTRQKAANALASLRVAIAPPEALELVPPPLIDVAEPPAQGGPVDPIDGARVCGIQGSRKLLRSHVMATLLEGPTQAAGDFADGLVQGAKMTQEDKARSVAVVDATSRLHLCCGCRLLLDRRWRDAFDELGVRVSSGRGRRYVGSRDMSLQDAFDTFDQRPQCVCVLGLGSAVPALRAAASGAHVMWVERVAALAECAQQLVRRNGLEARCRVVHVGAWEKVPAGDARFDAVITEEIGDDLLGDGLLGLARVARSRLLLPTGRFWPGRARVMVALASVRTGRVCGFDARPFNVFRNSAGAVYDLEQVLLNEPGCGALLSAPVAALEFDLDQATLSPPLLHTTRLWHPLSRPPLLLQPPPTASSATRTRLATASSAGVLNCLVSWIEIDTGADEWLSFAPQAERPRHMYTRALRQSVHFVGYERRVAEGDSVALRVEVDDRSFRLDAPPDRAAAERGELVTWPQANLLSYHFAMIAEGARNRPYERALVAAIRRFGDREVHVLDIGTGTGLLAMMAARASPRVRVSTIEMVPAVAQTARHIIARNGFAGQIQCHTLRSDHARAELLGGRADLLVSEIVDDVLIGDGCLAAIAHARRHLLAPGAPIIPRGGKMFAAALELRTAGPPGLAVDELNAFRCQQLLTSAPVHSAKLQRMDPSDYKLLCAPVQLFDFDWAGAPLEWLEAPTREVTLPLRFSRAGIFNAVAVWFSLDMDSTPENMYSSGLDNPGTHWDQPVRFLPLELHVSKGQSLRATFRHSEHDLEKVTLHGVPAEMGRGAVGFPAILASHVADQLGVVVELAA